MKEKERKLTEAEQKRLEAFAQKRIELREQGYKEKEVTVGLIKANIFAIVLTMIYVAIASIVYFQVNENIRNLFSFNLIEALIFVIGIAVMTVIHELIHGLVWGRFSGKNFKDIEFGFIKEYFTPYCFCSSELKRYQYAIGALMPGIVLGLLPTIIAILLDVRVLFALTCVMVGAAGGDILIVIKILLYKTRAKEVFCCDHPTEAGFVVFEK